MGYMLQDDSVEGRPSAFAYWGNIIAVGLEPKNVVLLDAITGNRTSVLSGHMDVIFSLTFSLGGTPLVSVSEDETIKLWDVQTGGVAKTFSNGTSSVSSVSISPDSATVASGTSNGAIKLWDVRTGNCHPSVMRHDGAVTAIGFSPLDPRRLISSSADGDVRQWEVNGHQIETPIAEQPP